MDIVRFASDDFESMLVSHPERIEQLPFGAILLDRDATVIKYNWAQGVIWGGDPSQMIGKNFFDDVSQCCRNTPVQFAFNKFLTQGFVDVLYEHEIVYGGKLVKVTIHVKALLGGDKCWVFTKLLSARLPQVPGEDE